MVRQLAVGAPIVSTKDVQSWKWTDWYWPEGYTKKLEAATWRALRRDPHFWRQLSALFPHDIFPLRQASMGSIPLVFMTRREGVAPWRQTVGWLHDHGVAEPLVRRLSYGEEKDVVCQSMGIQVAIEDSPRTIERMLERDIRVVMPRWPYNEHLADHYRVMSVSSLRVALEAATLIHEALQ